MFAGIALAVVAAVGIISTMMTNDANSANMAAMNENNTRNTNATNNMNLQSAREQMAFQERMSNSSYTRATQDMRRAGLNPSLAFMQGGASTPSGAMATAQTPSLSTPDVKDPMQNVTSSAMDAIMKGEQNKLTKEDVKTRQGQLGVQQADSVANVQLKAAQAAQSVQSAKTAEIQGRILEAEAKKAKLEGDWYSSKMGKDTYRFNKFNESVGGTLDSLNSAKDLLNPIKGFFPSKNRQQRGTGTMNDGTRFNLGTGEIIP